VKIEKLAAAQGQAPVADLRTKTATLGPAVASIIFLVLAVFGRWPYFLYVLLRLVVCVSAVYLAIEAYKLRRTTWGWIMAAAGVLFNPVIPIRMARADWQALDLLGAVVFAFSLRGVRERPNGQRST
jgi:FtsH-binding integral membrane protein